jgi:hypothetical protein
MNGKLTNMSRSSMMQGLHPCTVDSLTKQRSGFVVLTVARSFVRNTLSMKRERGASGGEDPNCDFGGHHYQPELGTVEGKLRKVVEHAVQLGDFYTWGGGGDIIKVTIKKV